MAEDQKEETKVATDNNITRCFEVIEFAKVEDKYKVLVQFDSNSESLSLSLTNQTTKTVFKQSFDKQTITQITTKTLKPLLLTQMIIDILQSKEKTAENLRIFILPNPKQGVYISLCADL